MTAEQPQPLGENLAQTLRFSCQGCQRCCRSYVILLLPGEYERLTTLLGVTAAGHFAIAGRDDDGTVWRIQPEPDGRCPFLAADGRCRIHAEHGLEAKPMACRLYPYTFTHTPNGLRLGLRFDCPTVRAGTGETLEDSRAALEQLYRRLERWSPRFPDMVAVRPGREVPWPDVALIEQLLDGILTTRSASTIRRLLMAAEFLEMAVGSPGRGSGPERMKFWTKLAEGIRIRLSKPWVSLGLVPLTLSERMMFRQIVHRFTTEQGSRVMGLGLFGRWRMRLANLWSGLRYMLLGRWSRPFRHPLRRVDTQLDEAGNELLERFLRTRIHTHRYYGAGSGGWSLSEGMTFLQILVAATVWLARDLAAMDGQARISSTHVSQALETITFGSSVSTLMQRVAARLGHQVIRRRLLHKRILTLLEPSMSPARRPRQVTSDEPQDGSDAPFAQATGD